MRVRLNRKDIKKRKGQGGPRYQNVVDGQTKEKSGVSRRSVYRGVDVASKMSPGLREKAVGPVSALPLYQKGYRVFLLIGLMLPVGENSLYFAITI